MKSRVGPGTVQSRSGITLIVGGCLVAGIFGYLDARKIDVPLVTRETSLLDSFRFRYLLNSDGRRQFSLARPLDGMVRERKYRLYT